MTGYRRSEPAFCRGCGIPWNPGADACASCGESLVVAAKSGGDPYAVIKLKRTMIAAGVVISGGWLLPVLLEEQMLQGAFDDANAAQNALLYWLVLRVALCLGAVATARWWYPDKFELGKPKLGLVAAGLALGVALPLALVSAFDGVDLGFVPVIREASALPGSMTGLLVLSAVALVAEEVFFRGLLFSGVASFGERTNAAIASAFLFGLFWLDPVLGALGIAAAGLRLYSRTVVPAIALRAAALATIVALVGA